MSSRLNKAARRITNGWRLRGLRPLRRTRQEARGRGLIRSTLSGLLAVTIVTVEAPIIVRHDADDEAHRALAERFPSLVHLDLPDGEGVLIRPNWVLTAAHVATEVSVGHVLTVAGAGVEAAEVVLHPEWSDGGPNDIGLIRLARGVDGIPPVAPYMGRDEVGRLIYVVGAGDTGTGDSGPAGNDGHVRAATNRVDEASPFWLKFRFDDPREEPSAATELEGISGPGDSGGPAYIELDGNQYVVGVSSGQSTAATGGHEGLYGVTEYYARVSSYAGWIEAVLGER
jgi:hypothetical protein